MNNKEQLSQAIATVERQISEAKSELAKKTLTGKLERLKEELKTGATKGDSTLSTLSNARKQVRSMAKDEFKALLTRLSKKPEYGFLAEYSQDRLKRDLSRTAKPKGYRFVGDNYKKPSPAQIKKGLKDGTVYYEGRPIRSDVSRVVKLEDGGSVSTETIDLKFYNVRGQVVESGKVIIDYDNETITLSSGKKYKVEPDREYTYKFLKTKIIAVRGIKGLSDFLKDINAPNRALNSVVRAFIDSDESKMAEGGNLQDRYSAEVGELQTVVFDGKEKRGYPVYVNISGYAPKTVGVYASKKSAQRKVRELKKKNQMASGGNIDDLQFKQISSMSGVRENAIKDWAKANNLSSKEVSNVMMGLGRKQIKVADFVTALTRAKDNSFSKDIIEYAKENKGYKMADGGNISSFNWKNFTLKELNEALPSDVEISSISTPMTKDLRFSSPEFKKMYSTKNFTISEHGETEISKGSENIYLEIKCYDAQFRNSEEEYEVKIYSKENHKGLKEVANSVIEKMKKGGNTNYKFADAKIKFRDLAKSNNFDIVVAEGRFEVELDSNNKVKSIVHPNGNRHKASECPIYNKYKKEINHYIMYKYGEGGNIDNSYLGRTQIGKSFYGWKAETTTTKKIKGYDWQIITMKRHGGDLVSTATGGKSEKQNGYSTFEYSPFEDPNYSLVRSKPKMVNEKAVTKQHEEAIKIFLEKINEFSGEKMATGGAVDNRMYEFLKDDLAELEVAIKENNQEEIDRFFSYWNTHLTSLKPKKGDDRMYNFLEDDLVGLEKAIKENNQEEIDKFFSYWNYHLSKLKMATGVGINSSQSFKYGGDMTTWLNVARMISVMSYKDIDKARKAKKTLNDLYDGFNYRIVEENDEFVIYREPSEHNFLQNLNNNIGNPTEWINVSSMKKEGSFDSQLEALKLFESLWEKGDKIYYLLTDKGMYYVYSEPKKSDKVLKEIMATGGAVKDYTYLPNKDISKIVLKSKQVIGKDRILDGAYIKKTLIKTPTKKYEPTKVSAESVFEKLKKTAKELEPTLKFGKDYKFTKEMVEKLLNAGYNEKEVQAIILGLKSVIDVKAENEFYSAFEGLAEISADYVENYLDRNLKAIKENTFELGLKYPNFNWFKVIKKYNINRNAIIVEQKEERSNGDADVYVYQCFVGEKIVIGSTIRRDRYKNNKLFESITDGYQPTISDISRPTEYQKERELKAGFNGGYWGVVSSSKSVIMDVAQILLSQPSGYVKEVSFLYNNLGGVGAEELTDNNVKFATGGNVENSIDELYKKSGFINDDMNWEFKLLELLQDGSSEAYEIYQSLNKDEKEQVLQALFEMDNDMGSYGDNDIETTKENLEIILEDAQNGKKYATGGSVSPYLDGMTEKEIMSATVVYDNGGKTLDRYTVFTPDGSVYGMGETASGFNIYVGDDSEIEKGSHLGKRLKSVPKSIQWAVLDRMKEEEFAEGDDMYGTGGTIRKMYVGDPVLYKEDVWYVTEKDGKLGITDLGSGTYSSHSPFIEASRIDMSQLTDMMGRQVEISKITYHEKGGSLDKVKVGDIIFSHTGVPVKVVAYDPDFGGSIKGVRMDKYGSGETSGWMSLNKFKFADGGNVDYTYVPNSDIDRIIAKDGKEYGQNVLLDGAYVTDKVRKPKMSRTQFEDETFEYGQGGGIEEKDKGKLSFKDWMESKGITVYKRTYYWVADDGGNDYMYVADTKNEVLDLLKEEWSSQYSTVDSKMSRGGGVDYQDIKKEKQKMTTELFEKCGVFFAFSDKQFEENKTPLKEGEKYVSIGGGGYMPKGSIKAFEEGMKAINNYGKQKVKKGNLEETEILYELQNHECFYTGDISDVVDLFEGTYTEKQIRDVYNKYREENQEYALGGEITAEEREQALKNHPKFNF